MGRQGHRVWIFLIVVVLLLGTFARELVAKSVDRFALWNSSLTTAASVASGAPAGTEAALRTQSIGMWTPGGVSLFRTTAGSEAVYTWPLRGLDPVNDSVTATPITTTLKRYISVGVTEDESQVKATAGVLVSLSATNAHATTNAFIKCTNATAASTTPGTTAVFYSIMVPANGGVVDTDINAAFSTALTCYIVTGKADTDVAEVAANDVHYNLRYR